ncbi:CEP76 C2 domain-containing protein [Chytriomyces cf. hyalinus JEL632]|nr:CEP76 C2 domain-containing protein [Chytriomyces cf. hyalinus JEL632]
MNGTPTPTQIQSAIENALRSDAALIQSVMHSSNGLSHVQANLIDTGVVDALTDRVEARLKTGFASEDNALDNWGSLDGRLGETEVPVVVSNTAFHARSGDKRHLMLSIHRGAAFLGFADVSEDARTSLALHLMYRDKRFESKLVMSSVEPAFEFQRLIELPSSDTQVLMQLEDKIHIVVTRTHHPSGQATLLGTCELDIRESLCGSSAGAPRRPAKKQLEVKEVGEDVTVGILEVVMECVPRDKGFIPVSIDEVNFQRKREQRQFDEMNRLFYTHAKQWWNDFLQIRSSHSQRLVKIFAHNESGIKLPVTNFIHPIRSRYIESPRHAVRFVSLMNTEKNQGIGSSKTEVWSHPHTIVTLSKGNVSSLANFLTSLLLGFNSPAFMALGMTHAGEPSSWVAVLSTGGTVEFIDPSSGVRYSANCEEMPWRSCGCLFNDEGFWANVGGTDLIKGCKFDVADTRYWKSLGRDAILSMKRPAINFPLLAFSPPKYLNSMDATGAMDTIPPLTTSETDLEAILKSQIALFRDDHDLLTVWDDDLSHLLAQCLWSCENGKLARTVTSGLVESGVSSVDFQEGVRRGIPEGHTFKGFPVHFNTLNPQKIFNAFTTTKSCQNLLLTRGDKVRYGIRVKVFGYAEKCVACWVMVAVRYRAYSE